MKTDCAGLGTVWGTVRDIDVFRDYRLNIHFDQVHVMYIRIEYIQGYHLHYKSSLNNKN